MSESKTIDNLGTGVSREYARSVHDLDLSVITDSFAIPSRTERLSLQPSYIPLEILGEKEKTTWADFPTPIAVPSKSIFEQDLVPGINSEQVQQIAKNFPKEEESKTILTFSDRYAKLQKDLDLSTQGRKRFIAG